MKRLLGIYREKECSPGRHQSNDVWLLDRVASRLRRQGVTIDLMSIEEAVASGQPRDAALVLSMCQARASLEILARWEDAGTQIVNSPRAARNTHRDRLSGLLTAAGVPFPPTRLVSTAGIVESPIPMDGGLWLKRGDVHASISADVQRVDSFERLRDGCAEFAARGIDVAAVQSHRAGDEVKFYGLAGGEFFHWLYSGTPDPRYAFDPASLTRVAARAASVVGLDIFGGDAIVGPAGSFTIIDVNDWPSFAPCRDRASTAIADYLARRLYAGWNAGFISTSNQSAV
jgi:hypothetical protein